MVLLSIFYTNQIHGGIISRLFFIHFVAPCACSSSKRLKILLQIFCMKIWARCLYIHLSVVFLLQNASRDRNFVTQPILLRKTFLIFDINHQQNTRRSDQIETMLSMIMQKLRALVSHGRFYQWLSCHFKEIFDQVRKDLDCELFYSELKRHNVSPLYLFIPVVVIIFHIVLENDNTVLIKRT